MMRGIEVASWGVAGRIPELKTGKSGTPYCSVSVGVTHRPGQDRQGHHRMRPRSIQAVIVLPLDLNRPL